MGMGHMAMKYEHTKLVYKSLAGGGKRDFIDLTRGLALINGKNCSQFSSKDKPLMVLASVRMSTDNDKVRVAKNTWMTRNACVKAAAAWRRTLRSAGIRGRKRLNTYARNPRFAYNEEHSTTWCTMGTSGCADLKPQDVPNSYETNVNTSESSPGAADGGIPITVYAFNADTTLVPWSASAKQAFTQTTFAVPQSGSVDVLDKPANLLGSVSVTACNVIAEYIDSRINDAEEEDTDMDVSPSNNNDFVMMLAPGEEVADDVLDNIDDEGKWRPYSMDTSTTACSAILPGANVAGQSTLIEAPLGLLEWTASSVGTFLVIDVIAITEM